MFPRVLTGRRSSSVRRFQGGFPGGFQIPAGFGVGFGVKFIQNPYCKQRRGIHVWGVHGRRYKMQLVQDACISPYWRAKLSEHGTTISVMHLKAITIMMINS
jgi:hypothetical protein